jgi:hypothetical protein
MSVWTFFRTMPAPPDIASAQIAMCTFRAVNPGMTIANLPSTLPSPNVVTASSPSTMYMLWLHIWRVALIEDPLRPKIPRQHKEHNLSASSSMECKRCKRKFLCSQSLQQHCASLKHEPLSRLECPIGMNCRGSFVSPSALLHHLESGRFSSGIHRAEIYQIVESCDLGIISRSPSASLASAISGLEAYTPVGSDSWALQSDTGSEWSMLTPSPSCDSTGDSLERWSLLEDSEPHLRGGPCLVSTTAQALRCPMYPSRRAEFSTLHSLQQHMESPAHSPKVYKCPALGQKLNFKTHSKRFSTLGGLCRHLESDSYKGGKRALFHCIEYVQAQLIQLGLGKTQLLLPHLQT